MGQDGGDVPIGRAVGALADFTRAVSAVTALDDLLNRLVAVATAVLVADGVRVGQVDHVHGRMRHLRTSGAFGDRAGQEPLSLTEPTALPVGTERVAVVRGSLDGAGGDDDRALLVAHDLAHGLRVPLVLAGGVWGELYVARSPSGAGPFSPLDEEVVTVLAGLAGLGLMRLLGDLRLRELAYTDALTDLANRRAADEQLEAWAADPEIARDLTLVLCDVNGLKSVNDTHGHVVGDQLIRELASHVSAAAGQLPKGFAARIGGDELLIASAGADQSLVTSVLRQLTESAAQLTYGSGLSCGAAWTGHLIRTESSPKSLVRSLLRIADAELYRAKQARRPRPAQETPPSYAPEAVDLGIDPTASRDEQLAQGALAICQRAGAVAWWLSAVDLEGGTVQSIAYGKARTEDATDGLWPPVTLDPTVFSLADFPSTERAVRSGEAFYVDTLSGDDSERRLLMQLGYQAVIAVGGLADDGSRGWLLEVYGDSLTRDLREFTDLLGQLARAVAG